MTNEEFAAVFMEAAGDEFSSPPAYLFRAFDQGKQISADPVRMAMIDEIIGNGDGTNMDLWDRLGNDPRFDGIADMSPQGFEAFLCGLREHAEMENYIAFVGGGYDSGRGYVGQKYHAFACGLMTMEFDDYSRRAAN